MTNFECFKLQHMVWCSINMETWNIREGLHLKIQNLARFAVIDDVDDKVNKSTWDIFLTMNEYCHIISGIQ